MGVGAVMGSRWRKKWFCVDCYAQMSWNVMMQSDGCCPYCGHLSSGTICATVARASDAKVAWTITKLKAVRWLLKPLLKLHIWYINRQKNMDRLDKGGS